MRYCLLFILLFPARPLFAQPQLSSGYGLYEGIFIQCSQNYKTRHLSGVGFGYAPYAVNDASYYAFILEQQYQLKWKARLQNFAVSARAVTWRMSNKYYDWIAITPVPSILYRFRLNKNVAFTADAGPAFSIVLHSRRKTFEEVAWPYPVTLSLRAAIELKL